MSHQTISTFHNNKAMTETVMEDGRQLGTLRRVELRRWLHAHDVDHDATAPAWQLRELVLETLGAPHEQ